MSFIKDLTTNRTITYEDLEVLSDNICFTDDELKTGLVFIECKHSPMDALIKMHASMKNNLVFYVEPASLTEYQLNEMKTTIRKIFKPVEDGILICTTSGTTGKAKFICHTKNKKYKSLEAMAYKMKLTSSDILYNIRGLGCVAWATAIRLAAVNKSALLISNNIKAEGILQTIQQEKPTAIISASAILPRMAKELPENDFIKAWYMSGSPLNISDAYVLDKKLKNGGIIQGCGRTESNITFSAHLDDPIEKRVATLGTPSEENAIKLVDNELYIKKENFFPLLSGNQEFTSDGWCATGDLLEKDMDGHYKFIGRTKLLINHGSFDINPVEIEEFVDSLEGIKKSCCVGVVKNSNPATRYPCLAVEGIDIDENELTKIIRKYFGFTLSKILIMELLPYTVTEKVDRQKITKIMQDCVNN